MYIYNLRKVIHYFSYVCLLVLFLFFKIIGKKNSSGLTAFIFALIGPYTKYHDRAIKNIKFVWPRIIDNKLKIILSGMWSNIGRNFGEFIFLDNYKPLEDINTKIVGKKILKRISLMNKKKNKGIIFFSAHYGNWELAPVVINSMGLEVLTIYRKSNNKYINNLIQKVRENYSCYTPKGDLGAKQSFLWLRKGKSLALAMDQKLNEGKPIKFLGKDSFTASAIAELAIRMNLDIVPIKVSREKFSNKITFYNKIKNPPRNLSHQNKVVFILEQVNDTLSNWIKEKPEQWLWIHRRWKKSLYD